MRTFIQYELKTVSINSEIIENAKVVVSERCGTRQAGNEIEVTEKNQGIPLLNKVYFEETDEFVSVDVKEEPQGLTQLDIIEANTSYLVMLAE